MTVVTPPSEATAWKGSHHKSGMHAMFVEKMKSIVHYDRQVGRTGLLQVE